MNAIQKWGSWLVVTVSAVTVRATRYFTAETDGLKQEWHGRVFLNPPYQRELMPKFVSKLVGELHAGRVTSAIMLVNNGTDTDWFREAADACDAVCFTSGRIRFAEPDGEDMRPMDGLPPTGQAFL